MRSSDEMRRVLRGLLSPPPVKDASERPGANSSQCMLYFTSDWVAPADARLQPALHDAAARMPVAVLRQSLLDGAGSSNAALNVVERAVPAAYVLPYECPRMPECL
ncbi:hypothetical protein Gpo141_00007798 [Globisporangium polare]